MLKKILQRCVNFALSRFQNDQTNKKESISAKVSNRPVNLQSRNVSPEKIQEDVEYAVQIGQSYLNLFVANHIDLQNKTVLEIGPGINYGSTLVLACHGANVMVTDRFLSPWDPAYHLQFYTLLRDSIKRNIPTANVNPLEKILTQGGYSPVTITCYASALEDLEGIGTASVDITLSNAVLEHIYDPIKAFKSLARVAKPGGFGFHQVDFRDHRDFSKPLEYLLIADDAFEEEFAEHHGERGNRYRPYEYATLFEQVGFQVHKFVPSCLTGEAYLNEFLPRLRVTRESKYQNVAPEDLREISGYYVLEKI